MSSLDLKQEILDLKKSRNAVILAHNHPSGIAEPSRADVQITNRIAEAGRLLGITVHDHVIIGKEGHVSLKARGLLPTSFLKDLAK